MRSRAGGVVPHFLLLLFMLVGVVGMHVLGHTAPGSRATIAYAAPARAMTHAAVEHAQAADARDSSGGHHGALGPLETCLAVLAGAVLLLGMGAAVALAARLIAAWRPDLATRPRRWTRGPPSPFSLRLRRTAVLRI